MNKEFDTTKGALFNVLDTWLAAARFCADVQYLMALQMMRLALGGSPVATEAPQVGLKKRGVSDYRDYRDFGRRPLCCCRRGLRGVPAQRARQLPQAGVLATALVPACG